MKVVFISNEDSVLDKSYDWSGYCNRRMLSRMPCELVICCSTEAVREHAPSADAVLLESLRTVSFRDELVFLNDLPLFIGAFHCDVWRGPLWIQGPIRIDLSISVYKAVALKNTEPFRDPRKFLFLPPRVDVYDYDVPRDIDVTYWGAGGREYPFRSFVYWSLQNLLVGGPRRGGGEVVKADPYLNLMQILLNGKKRTWAHLSAKRRGPVYHGPELFEFLHRCKLGVTGPVVQIGIGNVVARYFENAACGVVTMTSDMEDAEELGFVHGRNIWITDAEHFIPDMTYLLEHDEVVEEMSRNAKELIRTRHTVDIRAQELYDRLCWETGKT